MKSVRFDGIYNGKEAEVGHGVCVHIYIYACTYICVSVKFSLRKLSFTEVLVTFDLKNICIYIIYIYI